MKKHKSVPVAWGIAIAAVVIVAIVIALRAPVIFQRGNPFPYLLAASKISNETPYVQVSAEDSLTVYISDKGTCEELLDYITESTGCTFQERIGHTFLFSNGSDNFSVEMEIYWGRYSVWEVPDIAT